MTEFSVDFLGCKISHTDAETIREKLVQSGHSESAQSGHPLARVRVVNTCCITGEADKKSRKKVRQLLAEDAKVFVTGCGAALHAEEFSAIDPRVTVLTGSIETVADRIAFDADQLPDLGCKGEATTPRRSGRTRAFVKVQDGCNFHCSYCIVPTVRGDTRSRTVEAVVADVSRRAAAGQREIVLTGINIGLFRDPDTRAGLPQLVNAVADVEDVVRVRISSIESNHVDKRLVSVMAAHPKVCHHLHVPLQSGDDGVLRDMGRHYNSAGYMRAVTNAREAMPDLNLTTDIIVGYPSEDDAAFENTLQIAQDAGFTKVHAFPYSPRPGVATAGANPIPPEVKKARSLALRSAADVRAAELWRCKIGTHDEVMVERSVSVEDPGIELTATNMTVVPPSKVRGYTRDYCPVSFVSIDNSVRNGDVVDVKIVDASDTGLIVEVV